MTDKRSRLFTILLSALMIVILSAGMVSANGMPDPVASFKIKGLPEDAVWFMEFLTDEPPQEDRRGFYDSDEERVQAWIKNYGSDIEDADFAFADYASANGLNRTYEIASNFTVSRGIISDRTIDIIPYTSSISLRFPDIGRYRFAFYLADTGELLVTDPLDEFPTDSRYMFIDLSEREEGRINIYSPNPHFYRIMDLISRMVFTVIVETLTALVLFGVRDKRFLVYIAVLNLFSNGIFNLLFSRYDIVGWRSYLSAIFFVFMMLIGEFFVFLSESILLGLYPKIFKRTGFSKTWKRYLFSFAANTFSAVGSIFLLFYFDSLIW